MYSLNRVTLLGNLGADPEIRHLPSGIPVANFRMATTESYKDKTTGEKRDQTEWHSIVAWRGLAEVAEKYVKKGSKVYIEGKLRTRQWQDKDGVQRYTTEIQADQMILLDRPSGDRSGGEAQAAPAQRQAAGASASSPTAPPPEEEMDDLPF
ncbi:MAG: single-stranded DNA-binding protein [Flavobacteriales bacterium]|nr:single-stranded DNA-binding protein [Flavobacteriales bacterium]MBK9196350.1 single-stranded DNA-binding protein [Flavobacteriales bacterium]